MEAFQKLADALGESLETICQMQEKERAELRACQWQMGGVRTPFRLARRFLLRLWLRVPGVDLE